MVFVRVCTFTNSHYWASKSSGELASITYTKSFIFEIEHACNIAVGAFLSFGHIQANGEMVKRNIREA